MAKYKPHNKTLINYCENVLYRLETDPGMLTTLMIIDAWCYIILNPNSLDAYPQSIQIKHMIKDISNYLSGSGVLKIGERQYSRFIKKLIRKNCEVCYREFKSNRFTLCQKCRNLKDPTKPRKYRGFTKKEITCATCGDHFIASGRATYCYTCKIERIKTQVKARYKERKLQEERIKKQWVDKGLS